MKNGFFEYLSKTDAIEGTVYTVSEITSEIKSLLARNFGEPFWIKGEISNFRGRNAQGHIYFRLKDEKAVINAAFFSYANRKMLFELEEGMQVFANGRISLYEPHGQYQLIVEDIRPAGLGELFLKFEQLKKKLEKEGLFDPERKKEIPYIPERIGIITSPTGAALRDMLRVIRDRLSSVPITVFPARVQGKDAKDDLKAAIKTANNKKFGIDVIILGRGGGSIEELWPFNEEIVAKAIAASRIPVISAVGHETDFTISDFVADVRAATPSNAAEIAVPNAKDLLHRLETIFADIVGSLRERTDLYDERMRGFLRTTALKDPMMILRSRQQTLDSLFERFLNLPAIKIENASNRFRLIRESFTGRVKLILKSHEGRIRSLKTALETLNPHAVLERGYSIARDPKGRILKDHRQVVTGDDVSLTLSRGNLDLTVKKISPAKYHEKKKRK